LALSQSQKTLLTRAVSAVLAVTILLSVYYYLSFKGLQYVCIFAAFWGAKELVRILFTQDDSLFLKTVFFVLTLVVFFIAALRPEKAGLGFTLFSLIFCCFTLLYEEKFEDLTSLSLFQAKSILGFFYVGLLPSFAYRLFELPQGEIWFFMMLSVVFAGDTFAYLTGMFFGKRPLMPKVSPKKTIEGALGGLIGSGVVALLFLGILENIFWGGLIAIGVSVGIVAQLGDLFESMLKRVANKKDSGSIMPGHGGVLDRLDGVLFAAPVIFFFAEWLT
jgi:phosphatidate cytidylyltransferase